MGNADKVSLRKEVDLFLGSMKIKQSDGNKAYNLVEEYSKTKKNKSKFMAIMIFCCVIFTVAASFGVYAFVKSSNNKISININSFDDLNLRSLLNMVGRSEARYDNAVRDLVSIKNEYDIKKSELDSEKAGEIQVLESVKKVLSAKKIKANKALIEEKYNKLQKELDSVYQEKIKVAETEVELCKKDISRYDSNKLEKANKAKAVIDSQKQLYDLEIQKLTKKYETTISYLRKRSEEQQKRAQKQQQAAVEEVRRIYQARIDQLDPLIRGDKKGEEINIQFKNLTPDLKTVFGNMPEGEDLEAYVKMAKSKLSDFDYVSEVVANIPQENSIPSYVNAMRNLAFDTVDAMSEEAAVLQKKINGLQEQVEETQKDADFFRDYLENYFLAGIYDAFILDRVEGYEFQIFVSKGKLFYFEDETKKYNCTVYDDHKPITSGCVYAKNGKYYVDIKVPQKEKGFVVKNGYHLSFGNEITQENM